MNRNVCFHGHCGKILISPGRPGSLRLFSSNVFHRASYGPSKSFFSLQMVSLPLFETCFNHHVQKVADPGPTTVGPRLDHGCPVGTCKTTSLSIFLGPSSNQRSCRRTAGWTFAGKRLVHGCVLRLERTK